MSDSDTKFFQNLTLIDCFKDDNTICKRCVIINKFQFYYCNSKSYDKIIFLKKIIIIFLRSNYLLNEKIFL